MVFGTGDRAVEEGVVGYKDKAKQRDYARKWVAARRKKYFPGDRCTCCGSTEDLCLHHRDKKTKVGHNIWSWSKSRREAEIAKCDVVCASCHMELHAKEARVARIHGYSSTYKSGCRCAACREAHRISQRNWVHGEFGGVELPRERVRELLDGKEKPED